MRLGIDELTKCDQNLADALPVFPLEAMVPHLLFDVLGTL
jgi:hypothetical protein